jgi:beta-phosphoglucomutase-like phosphatase (HAD superfamily)
LFPPDLVFTADSGVGRGKPHPDIYLAAARALGMISQIDRGE